ncbi:response regulator [Chlorogloeopsis sp. ULAP01]|uniref:response regulator n=1 Tax=Chlorogloeopsis sp. ULAP01 TaxID=3056483 RepID=UPI0025AA5864|nr:response regulator [Chlorogloeopsis sp. ULAP01]MDM9381101.1 response regulator [Chlorogloeopsis sp. ULAP01]
MQGNLNEIDIRSILQLIELGQRTGQLFVEIHSDYKCSGLCVDEIDRHHDCGDRQFWFVFFLNGQIIYAANGDNSLSRLSDNLRHYQIKVQLDERELNQIRAINALEYAYLWMLLEQNIINPTQARSIIHSLVHETLFDLLNLQQGNFIFEVGSALTPQLTTLEIAPALTEMIKQVQNWKLLYPHIQSPDQIPVIADIVNLRSSLPAVTVNKLQRWADGKTSLRQLARYLNRDIVTLAKAIHPYIQQGWVQLLTHKSEKIPNLEENRKRCILCIDDAITICTAVESILRNQGYEAISQRDPLEALSLIFKLKPDLILCDITMPDLDGYEICAMLRHSQAFRQVPIIMLTAKEGFFDRVKAKMVGATDYLTKPFGNNELVILVEKYLLPFCIKSNKRDTPLVDSVKDRVKILSQN